MFDPSVFMPAFRDAGMLVQAQRLAYSTSFDCGFLQPDELLLGSEVHSAQILIEYETAAAADLAVGEELQIGGTYYIVRSQPQARGDGYFSAVQLERNL